VSTVDTALEHTNKSVEHWTHNSTIETAQCAAVNSTKLKTQCAAFIAASQQTKCPAQRRAVKPAIKTTLITSFSTANIRTEQTTFGASQHPPLKSTFNSAFETAFHTAIFASHR
jgi:hypothetical protein